MSLLSQADKNKLYQEVRVSLGWPTRQLNELQDIVLDTIMVMAMEDYSSYVSNWFIEQKWGELQGLDIGQANFLKAFTEKTMDYEKSFAMAYGKQTGIGTLSPWELKKDYVTISANTQVYTIPANREVNEVMWYTPSVIGSGSSGMGSPLEWVAGVDGWYYGGQGAQAMLPTYAIILGAQDRLQKRKVLQSELSYKVVGGANGTKQLFLYPIPNSADEMKSQFGRHHEGSKVWYWYYDTNNVGRDECLEANEDIIHTVDEVPLNAWKWDKLNMIARTRMRRLLVAKTKIWLGNVRGTFSGELSSPDQQAKRMDYQMFLQQGEREEETVYNEIKESLEKLSYVKQIEDKAAVAENINKIFQYTPPQIAFILK
jgi:hypothetical protein